MTTYALRLSDGERERYRTMAARARAEEGDLWALAGLVPGARVADVGCGPGAMLVALAEVVGPTGFVVGVDADPDAVGAARAALAGAALPGEVRKGSAEATGLGPGSVDAAVLRHVLAHNGGAEQRIVDHLATLVRPGGHVYLVDVDLASSFGDLPPVVAELYARYARWHSDRGNDLSVGRRLAELGQAAGLEVVEHRRLTSVDVLPRGQRGPAWAARAELVRAGLATPVDVDAWEAAFTAFDTVADRPQVVVTGFAAVCRRRPERGRR